MTTTNCLLSLVPRFLTHQTAFWLELALVYAIVCKESISWHSEFEHRSRLLQSFCWLNIFIFIWDGIRQRAWWWQPSTWLLLGQGVPVWVGCFQGLECCYHVASSFPILLDIPITSLQCGKCPVFFVSSDFLLWFPSFWLGVSSRGFLRNRVWDV